MTIKDAITILTLYRAKIENSVSIGIEEDVKAYDMAIKALQENEKLKARAEKWRLKAEEIIRLWNEEGEEEE